MNVFTPKIPLRGQKKSPGLPVIFWVHGGGFRRGSCSQYDPRNLVNNGVVVVTIQYRLGSLGYLSTKTKEL
ncbi:carboxylesterase family protein, partial [bacterium LRH843]|nr:carboxylesterase family protein [bacterium LRH843]